MLENRIENLVICSTLNQITNYLIIKKYNPKRIFNITFESNNGLNFNIKPLEWDKQLKQECTGKNIENVKLDIGDMYSLSDIKSKIEEQIIGKVSNKKEIYWHVTGGQRIIALAISDLIKEKNRKNDKLLYVEGNSEQLIINNNQGELESSEEKYGTENLDLQKVLHLSGFKTKKLDSTNEFKGSKATEKWNENEHLFYKKLYKIIKNEKSSTRENIEFEFNGKTEKDSFRNLLLKSNTISNNKNERIEFAKKLFNSLLGKNETLKTINYEILTSEEINKVYPAGYIFEKITAHIIYDVIKDNSNIIEMQASLKTYFNEAEKSKKSKGYIVDELDIILLTNTGKIINFECKSGGMEGDNAKSHNYTTYRLAGVFGMPILLSPLYESETIDLTSKNEKLKNQLVALRSAKAAELEVITLDKIEEKVQKLFDK